MRSLSKSVVILMEMLVLCAIPAHGQIVSYRDSGGKRVFINADPKPARPSGTPLLMNASTGNGLRTTQMTFAESLQVSAAERNNREKITQMIREMSADQPIERAATLEDIRAEVLTPDRLNSVVFGGFAMVALAIAVVGVAGVLAFSVSARTREFGIRLAIGSSNRPGT